MGSLDPCISYAAQNLYPFSFSLQGKKKILGYGNSGEGESRGKNGKLIIRVFIFNFITICSVLQLINLTLFIFDCCYLTKSNLPAQIKTTQFGEAHFTIFFLSPFQNSNQNLSHTFFTVLFFVCSVLLVTSVAVLCYVWNKSKFHAPTLLKNQLSQLNRTPDRLTLLYMLSLTILPRNRRRLSNPFTER